MKSESKVIMATQTNVQLVIQTSYIILDSVLEGKMFPVQIRERVLILDLCKQVDQLL
jgi:hypothetical protein